MRVREKERGKKRVKEREGLRVLVEQEGWQAMLSRPTSWPAYLLTCLLTYR